VFYKNAPVRFLQFLQQRQRSQHEFIQMSLKITNDFTILLSPQDN